MFCIQRHNSVIRNWTQYKAAIHLELSTPWTLVIRVLIMDLGLQ